MTQDRSQNSMARSRWSNQTDEDFPISSSHVPPSETTGQNDGHTSGVAYPNAGHVITRHDHPTSPYTSGGGYLPSYEGQIPASSIDHHLSMGDAGSNSLPGNTLPNNYLTEQGFPPMMNTNYGFSYSTFHDDNNEEPLSQNFQRLTVPQEYQFHPVYDGTVPMSVPVDSVPELEGVTPALRERSTQPWFLPTIVLPESTYHGQHSSGPGLEPYSPHHTADPTGNFHPGIGPLERILASDVPVHSDLYQRIEPPVTILDRPSDGGYNASSAPEWRGATSYYTASSGTPSLSNPQGDVPLSPPLSLASWSTLSVVSETPPDIPDPLLCPFQGCNTEFTGLYRRGNLGRHRRVAHRDGGGRYPCRVGACRKVYRRSDALKKHQQNKHPDTRPLNLSVP